MNFTEWLRHAYIDMRISLDTEYFNNKSYSIVINVLLS